jgi:hypothetical protein
LKKDVEHKETARHALEQVSAAAAAAAAAAAMTLLLMPFFSKYSSSKPKFLFCETS